MKHCGIHSKINTDSLLFCSQGKVNETKFTEAVLFPEREAVVDLVSLLKVHHVHACIPEAK